MPVPEAPRGDRAFAHPIRRPGRASRGLLGGITAGPAWTAAGPPAPPPRRPAPGRSPRTPGCAARPARLHPLDPVGECAHLAAEDRHALRLVRRQRLRPLGEAGERVHRGARPRTRWRSAVLSTRCGAHYGPDQTPGDPVRLQERHDEPPLQAPNADATSGCRMSSPPCTQSRENASAMPTRITRGRRQRPAPCSVVIYQEDGVGHPPRAIDHVNLASAPTR